MPPIAHRSRKRDVLEIQQPYRFREQGGINEVEEVYLFTMPTDAWQQVVE